MLAPPRRLALVAVLVFIIVLLGLHAAPYRNHIAPFLPPPASLNTGSGGSGDDGPGDLSHLHKPDQEQGGHGQEQQLSPTHERPGDTTTAKHSPHTTAGRSTETALTPSPSPTTPSPTATTTRPLVHHTFKPLKHLSTKALRSKIKSFLAQWTPPAFPSHWPPYDWYGTQRDYDPNRWEGLEWDNDFYIANGVQRLKEQQHPVSATPTPTPYLPYPDYNSKEWKNEWAGDFASCRGARGRPLKDSPDDMLKAYPLLPDGFPTAAVGSANATGIDTTHCFDRYNRFGPYGFNQDADEKVLDWQAPRRRPDWNLVNWRELQDRCLEANKNRYHPNARQPTYRAGRDLPDDHGVLKQRDMTDSNGKKYRTRTAILIRTWEGYVYTSNDIESIRAMATELSLLSGGEYQVFLFVNIKNLHAHIFQDERVYRDMLEQHVPRELHGISILWNERILEEWYPRIGDWQVYWHQFMALQWFSKQYPQFDYVWNWETDARMIGNHYHFLEKVAEYANDQPRKYLWERNARFYFPSAHGNYSDWLFDTHASIHRAVHDKKFTPVWGPQPYHNLTQKPIGPTPPHPLTTDDFSWGVSEPADLITLQPIWDPTHTDWTMRDKIWNYLPGIRPHFSPSSPIDDGFTHPDFASIPRRAFINTLARFSRRQLHAMHMENHVGRTMQAEMWPATVALQHGLKAVYVPHPIWTDRKWPGWYMDAVFNADGGETAQWAARSDSVYSHDREHNFGGWSWYYKSDFPRILYRRWLGWSASAGPEEQFPNNPLLRLGGEEFEQEGVEVELPAATPDGSQAAPAGGESFGGREVVVGGKGRMCLPPMLLHPIKRVYRGAEDDALRGTKD